MKSWREVSITIFTTSRRMSKLASEGMIAEGRAKVVVLLLAGLRSHTGNVA